MPIQIIPKEAAKLPLWQNILFYLSIGLVLSVLAAYGVLYHFTQRAGEDAEKIQEAIQQGKTPQMISLESQLQSFRDKVDDFASLIMNHKFSSNFFGDFESKTGILERDTHPRVSFSGMNLDTTNNTATLSGVTESLGTVGQQVGLFQNDEMVESVKLSKLNINKEGKIEFTLDITINPELLRSLELSK